MSFFFRPILYFVRRRSESGVAALPITLSVIAIAVLVSVTLALVGFSELLTSKSAREADEAFYVAEFGIQDALIRLTRGASTAFYQPEATTYPDLWTGTNDVGTNNISTACDEGDPSITVPNCTSCSDFNNTDKATCEAKEGCGWSAPNCTGSPIVATKLVCSEAKVRVGTKSEKKVIIQAVVDVDSRGIVKQCSWKQV